MKTGHSKGDGKGTYKLAGQRIKVDSQSNAFVEFGNKPFCFLYNEQILLEYFLTDDKATIVRKDKPLIDSDDFESLYFGQYVNGIFEVLQDVTDFFMLSTMERKD